MNKRPSIINTNSNPPPTLQPRGLRVLQAAQYSALSPFFIQELIRNGTLPAVGGPGTGISAYVVLREHLDQYLDALGKQAEERAEECRKASENGEVGERTVRYFSIAPRSRKPAIIVILESPRSLLTVDEAAQYLRVSRRTIYTLMEKKQLTYTRVREGLRLRLQYLNDYLDKRTVVGS